MPNGMQVGLFEFPEELMFDCEAESEFGALASTFSLWTPVVGQHTLAYSFVAWQFADVELWML